VRVASGGADLSPLSPTKTDLDLLGQAFSCSTCHKPSQACFISFCPLCGCVFVLPACLAEAWTSLMSIRPCWGIEGIFCHFLIETTPKTIPSREGVSGESGMQMGKGNATHKTPESNTHHQGDKFQWAGGRRASMRSYPPPFCLEARKNWEPLSQVSFQNVQIEQQLRSRFRLQA